ncbi:MAG: hypothetical protein HFF17_08635 [Oscillospiraceae bacterium]|nr:hypothetical protein [Oscillospiraceae bacterium]
MKVRTMIGCALLLASLLVCAAGLTGGTSRAVGFGLCGLVLAGVGAALLASAADDVESK